MKKRSTSGRMIVRAAGAAASMTLCIGSAMAASYMPGTNPEYIEAMRQQMMQSHMTGEVRFTPGPPGPGGNRRMPTNIDSHEFDPSENDYEIWWSYAGEGLVSEINPGAVQYGGQSVDPPNADFVPGLIDNFSNTIFFQLSELGRPFGFRDDGGQRTWQTLVKRAFDRWEIASGINFRFVPGFNDGPDNDDAAAIQDTPNGDSGGDWDESGYGYPEFGRRGEGDIRITMNDIDGPSQADGSSGSLLAYTYDNQLPPVIDRIDDMDTPDDTSDDIDLDGYLGNIIIDAEDRWNDPATPNLFATVMAREIGFALGMMPSCPDDPAFPFALLQAQIFQAPDTQPFPPLFFQEPQEDDIRAIQYIYGDQLEPYTTAASNAYSNAFPVTYAPVPNTNIFSFKPHLGIPQTQFPLGAVQLSLHTQFDQDRFQIAIPDTVSSADLRVSIVPRGTPFVDGLYISGDVLSGEPDVPPLNGVCDPATMAKDPSSVRDLRIIVESFDPFTNLLQVLDDQNLNPAGMGESTEIPISTGTYFVTVLADLVDDVQLYDISIEIETPTIETGLDALAYRDFVGAQAFRDEGYFGTNVTIGVVDGQHIAGSHVVFDGRNALQVNWPGIDPAVTTSGAHATTVAAVAAGAPFGAFEGLAPEAQLVSGTVANEVFGDGTFSIGKTALYFALFGMADRTVSSSLGLSEPASVLLSTWGGGGRTVNGEDAISQAFDAVGSMTQATVVVAAGNQGQFEGQSFANCIITVPDAEAPGTDFLGSRSIVPPATAFNVISVGAVGFVDPVSSPIEFADQEVVTAGFSSRGPIDSSLLTQDGTNAADARAGIDILAPGTGVVRIPPDFNADGSNLDPCDYTGSVPLSFLFLPSIEPGDDPDNPADPTAFTLQQGTSIAASIVAGSVALLQDLARDQSPELSTHPSVMKAILLNGAVKMEGWNNRGLAPGRPQDQRDGFDRNPAIANNPDAPLIYQLNAITTTPLDRTQGAGVLNLERSLENFFTGYPLALPPQTQFEGPTIDCPETEIGIPTIRRPEEPTGPGGVPGRPAGDGNGNILPDDADASQPVIPPSPIEVAQRLRAARGGDDAGVYIVREHQASQKDPDLKGGVGPPGGLITTGPQTPFAPPAVGGEGPGGPGGGGPPGGPPGAVDPGRVPREIEAIFVHPMGWDVANIDQRNIRDGTGTTTPGGFIDYVINVPLLGERPDPNNPGGANLPADRLTITLTWLRTYLLNELSFANPDDPRIGTIRSLELENLNLELYLCDSLGNLPPGATPVRASNSAFNNSEHIFTDIPQTSLYLIRVRWVGTQYDVFLNQPLAEQVYGLAWRVDFSPRQESLRPMGIGELVDVLSGFGGAVGSERYEIPSDVNLDGLVDWQDINMVLKNWNNGTTN